MFSGNIEKNFIVFEGIDGAGKTSLVHALSQVLVNERQKVFSTFEPSEGFAGTFIRELLSKKNDIPINSSFFTYLYAADRYEHIYGKNGIYTHINNDNLVLCDRYLFSSYVYQGFDEELLHLSIALNKDFPLPSILFFLDISPEISIQRLEHRKTSKNQELHSIVENATTLQKIYKRYHTVIDMLLQQSKVQCHYLDATQSTEELTKQCLDLIHTL